MNRAYLEKEVPLIRLQPSNVFNEVKRRQDLLLRLQNHRRVGVSAGNLKHPCRMRLKWQQKLCCTLEMCKRCLQSEKIKNVMKTHLIRSRGGRRVLYGRGRHRLRCWLLRSRRTHRGSSSCCGGCRQRVDHSHPPELVSAMYIYTHYRI